VYLDFENGAAATAVYNGYGHFSTAEWCFDIGEWGFPRSAQSAANPGRALSRGKSSTPSVRAHATRFRHPRRTSRSSA
jgi:phthalate 4,5-cis-dihydrodiol dehydrogenase